MSELINESERENKREKEREKAIRELMLSIEEKVSKEIGIYSKRSEEEIIKFVKDVLELQKTEKP